MGSSASKTAELKPAPTFKIVLIGDSQVGKSSILLRYSKHQFQHEYIPTKSTKIENVVKKVNLPDDLVTCVTLWDLPGSEDMDLRDTYYMDADAAIVVVDMSDESTIELAGAWKQDFQNRVTKSRTEVEVLPSGVRTTRIIQELCDSSKIPVLLLGNKYDLVAETLWTEKVQGEIREEAQHHDDYIANNIPKSVQRQMKQGKDLTEDPKKTEGKSNTIFGQIRGPKNDEKKPQVVQLLESVELQFGFVGSVMVSAKDGDNSVALSIQHLVRYLLQNNVTDHNKKSKERNKRKIDIASDEDPLTLLEVKNEQFDEIFKRCHIPLKRSGEYIDCYNFVLKKLKEKCAEGGMITNPRPSLEDCILGIKGKISDFENIELQVIDHDNFVRLEHTLDHRVKIPREITMCITHFNVEFGGVCKAILRDCPTMDMVLDRLEQKIIDKCERIDVFLPNAQESEKTNIVDICDKNRARIAFARKQIVDILDKVSNAILKTKAASVW